MLTIRFKNTICLLGFAISLSFGGQSYGLTKTEKLENKLVNAFKGIVNRSDFIPALLPNGKFQANRIDLSVICMNWKLIEKDLEKASQKILDQKIPPKFFLNFYKEPITEDNDDVGDADEIWYTVKIFEMNTSFSHKNVFARVLGQESTEARTYQIWKPVHETRTMIGGSKFKVDYTSRDGMLDFAKVESGYLKMIEKKGFLDSLGFSLLPNHIQRDISRPSKKQYFSTTQWMPLSPKFAELSPRHFFWRVSFRIHRQPNTTDGSAVWKLHATIDIGTNNRLNNQITKLREANVGDVLGVLIAEKDITTSASPKEKFFTVTKLVPETRQVNDDVLPSTEIPPSHSSESPMNFSFTEVASAIINAFETELTVTTNDSEE